VNTVQAAKPATTGTQLNQLRAAISVPKVPFVINAPSKTGIDPVAAAGSSTPIASSNPRRRGRPPAPPNVEAARPEITSLLSESSYLRLHQLIGDKYATPVVSALVPVSKATIYNWMKAGTFPQQVVIGPNTVAWRITDIRAWLDGRRDWKEEVG